MSHNIIFRSLEIPIIYRIAQFFLAPGSRRFFNSYFKALTSSDQTTNWLDIGCGPKPFVKLSNQKITALDINAAYVTALHKETFNGVVGDATSLPFPNESFCVVSSVGLLHHLPDEPAKCVLNEMLRIIQPYGRIIVLDAVLPKVWWRRPYAYLIRRFDRGRHMRTEFDLRHLLPNGADWHIDRQTYTFNGLELLICDGQRTVKHIAQR